MFLIFILLCTLFFTGDAKFYQPEQTELYCAPSIDDIEHKKEILIFDVTENDNYPFELCLNSRIVNQSIIKFNDTLEPPTNTTDLLFASFSPNIMIILYDLSLNMIFHPSLYFMFRSLRSNVFIIIKTQDELYKCEKGVFNETAKSAIEDFLNVLWFEHHMFKVILEFPFTCPRYFVIYKGRKETNYKYYNRTIISVKTKYPKSVYRILIKDSRNLIKGYPIRANLFMRFPTSINMCDSIHYYTKIDFNLTQNLCGMDAFIMQDVFNYFKFNVTFPEIANIDSFGYAVSNNNITGSLGYLIRDYFDISFNSRFMVKYIDGNEIKYLHYIGSDSICAILKTPNYTSLWYYPFGSFEPCTWIILLLIMTFIGITSKILTFLKKKIGIKFVDMVFINYISTGFFGCMIKPMKASISILRGTCLIISVILVSMYQGHINYMYTTMVREPLLKTIKDLWTFNIEIRTSQPVVRLLGGSDALPISPSQIYYDGYNNLSDLLVHDNWATLQRRADVILETQLKNYIDKDGTPLLYLIDQCFSDYYLSYITRKDFPFSNDLTVILMRMVEAGLPRIYYRWTMASLKLQGKLIYTSQQPRPFTPSTMEEERIAFSFLLIGYFMSSMIFVMERWWAKRN